MKDFLFPDCKISYGYKRNLILDLTRQEFYIIPKVTSILDLDEQWLFFLRENEIITKLPVDCIADFREINFDFKTYSVITNAVIFSTNNFVNSINLLERFLCQNFLIIINKLDFSIENLNNQLSGINNSYLNSVTFNIENSLSVSLELLKELNDLCEKFNFIKIVLFDICAQLLDNYFNDVENNLLDIRVNSNSGIFQKPSSPEDFVCNITYYSEALRFNTFLNRKIFIDENGYISNSPDFGSIFGQVSELYNADNLLELFSSKEVQYYYEANKDSIDVCRECEFKHICFDNRIPYKRKDDTWFNIVECNYNPFIAKWKGEEGYKTLIECGIESNKNGFKIDQYKLNQINEVLWGEDT